MRLAFFPGCLIPVKYPYMEAAIRKTLPKLGIEIVDLNDFSCCPDPIHYKAADNLGWLTIAARNLCIAEEENLDIFTICSGCTETLSEASYMLSENEELKYEVNKKLARIGKEYKGKVQIRHIVAYLRDEIGVDKITSTVTRPLNNVMVAVHYGCHLLKPSHFMAVDDPDDPHVMDKLINAIGGNTCRHREWYLCCGRACQDQNLREDMTRCVLDSVKEMEADCMGMICPTCFSSFDLGQIMLARKFKDENKYQKMIPPVYYFQLLGLAQGLYPEEVGLNKHKIKMNNVLEKIGL
jgi:heterodisulfide reductase subunit B